MEKLFFVEPEKAFDSSVRQSASYVRRSFDVEKEIASARLYITALGVYKGYINGISITDEELMPGYTDYKYRLQCQTYDVRKNLQIGKNVISVVIGDGWYRGGLGASSMRNCYGERIKIAFCLEISYIDGTEACVDAREAVASQSGPLRENDIKISEVYDATKEHGDWRMPEFDDSHWHPVYLGKYDGKVVPHRGEAILTHEKFRPNILCTPNGDTVLDFGQNMMGRIYFRIIAGKKGQKVSLLFGETLDKGGNFTMENLHVKGTGKHVATDLQRLEYICRDGLQEYTPMFLTCGFRYVKLIDWPEEVRAENFSAYAIYSDLKETGTFTCSNEMINKLVNNVRWSQKSNFVDIPTDCPTRERTGWTADISVFAEAACYLTDISKFIKKWMEDYVLEQAENGNLPFVVPDAEGYSNTWGCMGWSNALSNVAMTLYDFYGDTTVLEMVYEAVQRFVAFNLTRCGTSIKSCRYPAEARRYLIDSGFHFGEWLEPGSNMVLDFIKAMICPDMEVTTGWFYKTTEQLGKMAEILGKERDAEKYRGLADKIKEAYQTCFIHEGKIRSRHQSRYVRPLSMGLVDGEIKRELAETLDNMCRANQYCVGTGFLTTWRVLHVLSDNGYAETAYKMLENTECPGWLYTVKKGGTTTWERWDGIDEDGNPKDSLNHYAMGSVISWLFSRCAGIRPLKPGFREVLIKPVPGGTLTYARAEYKSAAGTIVSSWKRTEEKFVLRVQIPKGIRARIELPDQSIHYCEGGEEEFVCGK